MLCYAEYESSLELQLKDISGKFSYGAEARCDWG